MMTSPRHSIQWRIFSYYTAIFTVAIVLLAAGHFWATVQSARRMAEMQMQEEGVQLMPLVFPPPDWSKPEWQKLAKERPVRRGPVENPIFFKSVAQLQKNTFCVLLVNWQGQEIFRSKNTPPDFFVAVSPSGSLKLKAGAGTLGVEVRTRIGDVIALGLPLSTVRKQALQTLPQTAVLALLVLGGFSFFGFRLIKRGLKPIHEISRAAQHIAGGALHERIPAPAEGSELGQLAHVLNHTFDRIQEVLSRQKQFTADASHELRTPVASILADCEFSLKRERSPARYRETIEVCHEAARHMRQLIDALGLLARFDAGEAALVTVPCDLAPVAADAVILLRPLARERGITLECNLAPAPCLGDAARLGQVARNLLSNAIVHNRREGSVRLSTGSQEGEAWLAVEDTGPGIPPEMAERIFGRFFRLDKARRHPESGSGLGLAICKAIVDAHGGKIEVSGAEGIGSTFRVRLKLAETPSAE